MTNIKITMVELKVMLQYFSDGLSEKSISERLHLSRTSIRVYKQRALSTGQSFSALSVLSDKALADLLTRKGYSKSTDTERLSHLSPLLEEYARELQRPYVGYDTLWEEYRKMHPDGYSYNRFREILKEYTKAHSYAYHTLYAPGHEMQVDFAGDKLWITDRKTHQKTSVVVLCCILPYSSMTFMMALYNASMEHFYYGLSKCMEYFGGVPEVVKSDNMTQWVKRSDRYEPEFNEVAMQWGLHYGTELEAARVKKPRDKGAVEGAVYKVYKHIYAKIRDEVFYSLDELNSRIFELLDAFNSKCMYGRESRIERFNKQEQSVLKPLPSQPYRFRYKKTFTVNSTYHVSVGQDKHLYSVPYQFVNRECTVSYDNDTVEIWADYERIAIHKRCFTGGYSTVEAHMPPNHAAWQRSKEYNAEYFMFRSAHIGPYTKIVTQRILESKPFVQQAYKSCQGILSLVNRYTPERVEAACKRASESTCVNYGMIKRILEKGLDKEPAQGQDDRQYIPINDNVRGASNYN